MTKQSSLRPELFEGEEQRLAEIITQKQNNSPEAAMERIEAIRSLRRKGWSKRSIQRLIAPPPEWQHRTHVPPLI